MNVRYRVRRTEYDAYCIEMRNPHGDGYVLYTGHTSMAVIDRKLHDLAADEGLTVFHRDVFSRVQKDGSHEVMALAASM